MLEFTIKTIRKLTILTYGKSLSMPTVAESAVLPLKQTKQFKTLAVHKIK